MDHITRRDEIATAPRDVPPAPDALEPIGVPSRWRAFDLAGAVVAWVVVVAIAGYLVYRNAARPAGEAGGAAAQVTAEVEGRYLVGTAHLLDEVAKVNPGAAKPSDKEKLLAAAESLDRGPLGQRLRYVVLVGELAGPTEARIVLAELENESAGASESAVQTAELLNELYEGYEAGITDPSMLLDDKDQQRLRTSLRWYGDLALAPEGGDPAAREAVMEPALRTVMAFGAAAAAFVFGLLAGLAVLGFAGVRAWQGKLRPALTTGASRGGVYAETFALYLTIFFGVSFAMGRVDLGRMGLLASLAVMFFSLIALGWPVLRGVPWRQVRQDVGLTSAGRPVTMALMGPVTYVSALPLLGVSLALVALLMRLLNRGAGADGGPSHPVVGLALKGDWLMWVQLFLVAVVGAPIVEEIMFRGVLYRHLRELTGGWAGPWLSVTVSVLVTGFVFAVIHPQGWLGVPLLMSLATAFAMAREFQRSLVPPMIAHGINNGAVLLLLMAMVG